VSLILELRNAKSQDQNGGCCALGFPTDSSHKKTVERR
jgi:hypothetical protein